RPLCFFVRSLLQRSSSLIHFFFFNDTATTEIYTLSLHDALPICQTRWATGFPIGSSISPPSWRRTGRTAARCRLARQCPYEGSEDRKSTRLNSSHDQISYAVFCLKKKKKEQKTKRIYRLQTISEQ